MKDPARKEYTNGEITVIWKPALCIHSENCFMGLPQVFDPSERPWIDMKGAPTNLIEDQVSQCPSGALTYRMNTAKDLNNYD